MNLCSVPKLTLFPRFQNRRVKHKKEYAPANETRTGCSESQMSVDDHRTSRASPDSIPSLLTSPDVPYSSQNGGYCSSSSSIRPCHCPHSQPSNGGQSSSPSVHQQLINDLEEHVEDQESNNSSLHSAAADHLATA